MRTASWFAAAAFAVAVGGGVSASDLQQRARDLFSPIPAGPARLEANPATPEKVELGRMLFFEPRLSKSGLISCNTCHSVSTGGADNLKTSIGHRWQKGPRNAPTVLNAVFNTAQFWDGRAKDLAAQAKGPVQAGVEMGNTAEGAVATLKSMREYVRAFALAFPGGADPVTFDNMALAIESFEATLTTPNAPLDRFMAGDDAALTSEQKHGLELFAMKGCGMCHRGVNLGGQGYYPFGLQKRPGADILPVGDKGRFAVTKTATDEYVFRAAPLRNIALTAPYFHSGEVWDLREAVSVMGASQLGTALGPQEVADIAAFMGALTGDQPKVIVPILPPSSETTPRPES